MPFDYSMAEKLLNDGEAVESLVSCTSYKKNGDKLYAECVEVCSDYITNEEKKGLWRSVRIIETREDFEKLSHEEQQSLIKQTLEQFKQKRQYDIDKGRIKE